MSATVERIARSGSPVPPAIFGLSPAVRLDRQLARLKPPPGVLLIGEDIVIDTPALNYLLNGPPLVVTDAAGRPLVAWLEKPDAALSDAFAAGRLPASPPAPVVVEGSFQFVSNMKKREPFMAYALDRVVARTAEDALYYASYKGVTDIVTKHAWPVPALAVVRACVGAGISPNMVTTLSIILSIAAIPLFIYGYLALGLACAWGMTFLDTVDGKLARVTVSYSNFGNYFDHIPDIVFPPLWWLAFMAGVQRIADPGVDTLLWSCFGIIMGSYVVGRLCEGVFTLRNGFAPFLWRAKDARFRLILARRNPNLLILTAAVLFQLPAQGYYVLTLWCAVCAVVQLWNLAESEWARRAQPLASFLQDPA